MSPRYNVNRAVTSKNWTLGVDAGADLEERAGENGGHEPATMRAECGANADLARPTRDGEGHQCMDAARGKQQHDEAHQPRHGGQSPVDPSLLAADLAELLYRSQPDPRVDLGRDRSQARCERVRIPEPLRLAGGMTRSFS
jgi:hypothetical protein